MRVSAQGRLLAEHDRIRALADALERMAAGRRPEDATAFWRLRWQLLSLILQNLRHERTSLARALSANPAPDAVAVAERFDAELAELSKLYLNHIARWDRDERMIDWTLYADQLRPLLAMLRDRLEREERQLYPLLWPPA